MLENVNQIFLNWGRIQKNKIKFEFKRGKCQERFSMLFFGITLKKRYKDCDIFHVFVYIFTFERENSKQIKKTVPQYFNRNQKQQFDNRKPKAENLMALSL